MSDTPLQLLTLHGPPTGAAGMPGAVSTTPAVATPAGQPVPGAASPAGHAPAAFGSLLAGLLQAAQPVEDATATVPAADPDAGGEPVDAAGASPATVPGPLPGMAPLPPNGIPPPPFGSLPAGGNGLPAGGERLPPEAAGPLSPAPSRDGLHPAAGAVQPVAAEPPAPAGLPALPAMASRGTVAAATLEAGAVDGTDVEALPDDATLFRPPAAGGAAADTRRPPGEPITVLRADVPVAAARHDTALPLMQWMGMAGQFNAPVMAGDGQSPPAPTLLTPSTATMDGPGTRGPGLGPALPPLHEAGNWAQGLGDRLVTLAGNPGHHTARLQLYPEQLGALQVEIQMADDTAEVWIGSSHAVAREAVEAALPRLRELFAEQGIQLVRAEVGDSGGQARSGHHEPATDAPPPPGRRHAAPAPLPAALLAAAQPTTRLLDTWA